MLSETTDGKHFLQHSS